MPSRKRLSYSRKDDFDPRKLVISWTMEQLGRVQPWKPFMDIGKISVPKTIQEVGRRVHANVDHFQSNYGIIFVALVACCVLASPGLLLGVLGSGCICGFLKVHTDEESVILLNSGMKLSKVQRAAIAASLVLPILYAVDAWSAVIWSFAACLGVSLLHASFHHTSLPSQPLPQKLEAIPEENGTAPL